MLHRWVIVAACFGSCASVPVLGAKAPKNFLPTEDESQFAVTIRAPEGTSLDGTRLIATRMATEVQKLPGVKYTVVTIGDDPQKTPNLASIYTKLAPADERKMSQQDLIDLARREVTPKFKEYNLRTSVGIVPAFSGGGGSSAGIQYIVRGPNLEKLTEYSTALLARLKAQPGVVDADSSLILGKPEVRSIIDRRKAADLGVDNSLCLIYGAHSSRHFEPLVWSDVDHDGGLDLRGRDDGQNRDAPGFLRAALEANAMLSELAPATGIRLRS